MLKNAVLATVAFLVVASAVAQQPATNLQPELIQNRARDLALGHIGAANFLVGRIGRDCLALVGRSDSPQEFAAAWQARNQRFVSAAAIYMERVAAEIAQRQGIAEREKFVRTIRGGTQAQTDQLLQGLYSQRGQKQVCDMLLPRVESGGFDLTPKDSRHPDLEALADWAAR